MTKEEWAKLSDQFSKVARGLERKQQEAPNYEPYATARYVMLALSQVADGMAQDK